MHTFNNFKSLENYLTRLGLFRMELGLGRMQKALSLLNIQPEHPHMVQIIGTNGKGSTACFLQNIALRHGAVTGLFISPHLVSVKERIRICAKPAPDGHWLDAAEEVLARCNDLGLTYFEFLTLVCVLIFKRAGVDLAIMEAGLGGRHDATTALGAGMQIFTGIDLDHTDVLGKTVPEIARDKAMAVHKGSKVVLAHQAHVHAETVIKSICSSAGAMLYQGKDFFVRKGSRVIFARQPDLCFGPQNLGLGGDYQVHNAMSAVLAWQLLAEERNVRLDRDKCLQAMEGTFFPGRMHVVSRDPQIILDGAHNPAALSGLLNFLKKQDISLKSIVFTCLNDKEIEPLAEMIKYSYAARILVPDMESSPRKIDRNYLLSLLGHRAEPLDDLQGFFTRLGSSDGPVLVCGSLYLLGYIYSLFPQWLDSVYSLTRTVHDPAMQAGQSLESDI